MAEAEQRQRAEQNEQEAKSEEQKAKEREAETKAVLDFVQDKVFAAARPKDQELGLGHEVKLADAIKQALPFIGKSFPDQPLIEARLRMTIGLSFWYLGDAKTALAQFEAACRLYEKHRGPDHPDTLGSMMGLANSYAALGRHAEALKLLEETLQLQKSKLGRDHPDTLTFQTNLALSLLELKRPEESLPLLEDSFRRKLSVLPANHHHLFVAAGGLAECYTALDRGAEATATADKYLAHVAGKEAVQNEWVVAMLTHRNRHLARSRDAAGCRATAEMYEKLKLTAAESLYNAACFRGIVAGLDSRGDDADRAMEWLRKAVAAGYKDVEHLKKDTALDALRDREDFKKLIAELEIVEKKN